MCTIKQWGVWFGFLGKRAIKQLRLRGPPEARSLLVLFTGGYISETEDSTKLTPVETRQAKYAGGIKNHGPTRNSANKQRYSTMPQC